MRDKYFAINLKPEELLKKVDQYFSVMEDHGILDAVDTSYNYYYGVGKYGKASKITSSGKQGELSELMVNDYRSFLRYMLTLVASERPSFDVRAINTDYKSAAQALVGEDVLNYYLKHRKLETLLRDAVEHSLWSGEGFIGLDWDVQLGEQYGVDPDTGSMVMKGDIRYSLYNSKTCIRDPLSDPEDPDWVILVDRINRFDLAARFPESEEEILDSTDKFSQNLDVRDTDMINVYTFYHKRSILMPEGKYSKFIGTKLLTTGPLPYDEVPVYRVAPSNFHGTVFGYTQGFDILGLQEANDDMFSALLSNNRTFARQLIALKRDAGINPRQLTEGMTFVELDVEDINKAIQPIQLTKSAQETYNFLDSIVGRMEKYTGINEVIRGDPSANLRSGNALALIAAQSVKYNATLQQSYNQLLEDVGTATLKFLKTFAAAPRFYTVVGLHNKSLLKEFSSESIEYVDRVEVQRASAITNTTAGKIQLADNLLQSGMIQRPQQYIAVLETGKLDPLVESERTEILNIKSENELLFEGETPVTLLTDNHMLHIKEHQAVLNDPELRKIPEVVTATGEHIREHIELWQSMPPALLMATNQQQAPLDQQMPMEQPQQAPAQDGGEGSSESLAPNEPGQVEQELPQLPDVPDMAGPEDQAALAQMNLQQPN